jgi:hypothetical protein
MDEPTPDEVRDAKAEVARMLKDHPDYLGAGIGRGPDGQLVVQVNWRTEPTGITLPQKVGKVTVTHQVVGSIKPY